MVIDEILGHNERFVQRNTLSSIGHAPRRSMAVVTCMDCRLVQMFEQALGLERGDVLELRTAGATIPKPERADPQTLIEKEKLGNVQGLMNWLGAFDDVHINVKEVVDVIRDSPYLPKIPVHGLVIDINTGELEVVDRGGTAA